MTLKLESTVVVVAATTVASILVIAAVTFWRQKKKEKIRTQPLEDMVIPTKWKKIGEIGELIIYPLKGGKRKCVTEGVFTKRGLKEMTSPKLALRDRVFIVFDEKHDFMNVKKNPKLLFVETSAVDKDSVKFSYPDANDLIIHLPNNNNTQDYVELYQKEIVKTVDCGDEAATWFSQRLLGESSGLRLGCFIDSLIPERTIDGYYDDYAKVYTKFHSGYMGSYSDLASYMLMGEESVKDLNSRLDKPVNEHHFRPNVVVTGSPAFSEDSWDWVKVGDSVVLRGFKYCTRCVVTSIDPDTGKKDPTTEPLRTLRKYRQVKEPELKKLEGASPVMGLYAGCHQPGIVRVGDAVYVNAE